jgi:hypothetical protein
MVTQDTLRRHKTRQHKTAQQVIQSIPSYSSLPLGSCLRRPAKSNIGRAVKQEKNKNAALHKDNNTDKRRDEKRREEKRRDS